MARWHALVRPGALVAAVVLLAAAVDSSVAAAGGASTQISARPEVVAASPRCVRHQLVVGGLGSSAATGAVVLTVRVTNVSPSRCRLEGRPGVEFVGAAGEVLSASVDHHGPGTAFAAPAPVALDPGATAGFVVVSRDHLADQGSCESVRALRLALPGRAGTFSIAPFGQSPSYQLCGAGDPVEVSALVPDAVLAGYAPPLPPCRARELTASLGQSSGAAGTSLQVVVLVSHATATCTLEGYPVRALLGPAGRVVLRFTAGKVVMAMPDPALPRPVTVVDGGRAQFELAGGDYDVVADTACPSSTELRIGFPSGGGLLVLRRGIRLCDVGGTGAFTALQPLAGAPS